MTRTFLWWKSRLSRQIRRCWRMLDINEIRKKFRQAVNAYVTNRKLIAASILGFLLFLYFWPSWLGLGSARFEPGVLHYCLEEQLRHYTTLEGRQDVFIRRLHSGVGGGASSSDKLSATTAPWIGNGLVGILFKIVNDELLDVETRVESPSREVLSIRLEGFDPLLSVNVVGADERSATAFVTLLSSGIVRRISSYTVRNECITVTSSIYAHRKYPNAVIQEVIVDNPTSTSVEVDVADKLSSVPSIWKRKKTAQGEVVISDLAEGEKPLSISALVGSDLVGKKVVEPKRSETYRHVAVIHLSSSKGDKESSTKILSDMYRKVSSMSGRYILAEHERIWRALWRPAFSISRSLASDVLNGNLINATRYALLSNTRAPIHEEPLSSAAVDPSSVPTTSSTSSASAVASALLRKKDMCFNKAHNTLMYQSKLWSPLADFDEIAQVAYKWRLTLTKSGCQHLVEAGADGISEAMVLSFGAWKFSRHHLEYGTQPSELHRQFFYGGLSLAGAGVRKDDGSNVHLNVWVEVSADNTAHLSVAVEDGGAGTKSKWYACDAGCLGAPVELSAVRQQFAVKQTEPPTAILYISSDKRHMHDLKHTIHVLKVAEAPAIEQHVLALHEHGHHLAGLPTSFWVLLIILIVAFHLILLKLVYNEWIRYDRSSATTGVGGTTAVGFFRGMRRAV